VRHAPAASDGRTIAVVATAETADRGIRFARALQEAGDAVTLVVPKPLAGIVLPGVSVLIVGDPEAEVTPSYLRWSYSLSRALAGGHFDAIVFPSRGGHAYCTARARQVGAGFASTTVVVDCVDSALRRIEHERQPFVSKWLLGVAVTERLALELADAFVCEQEDLLDWLGRRQWKLPAHRVPAPDGRAAWPAPTDSVALPEADHAPPVSVVIAFHERTSYLPFCLDGLARQTRGGLEVIVADDGSRSAPALELLKEVEQRTWPWPLRVLHLPHGGLGPARNGGWRAASADLVLFIDDDDVPFEELVAALVRARVVSDADVAVAGARFFRGEGRPVGHPDDVIRISICDPHELGAISNQYGGPVGLWPRKLLEQLGGFAAMPTEDWDLLARATYAGARITTSPEPLYWYRQTPGSMYSADPYASRDAGLAIRVERIAERLPDEWRLLPHLAAGAYSELERRGRESKPGWRTAVERGRLLAKRARQAAIDEGISAVGREAVRFARRRYDRS
jgi:glycosyltransferase involved in cell wall biosynthesis